MGATFLIGVFLKILSCVAGVVGKQLIGLSARIVVLWHARAIFMLGTLLTTVLGAVFEAIAYGFAAQSVVAPINSVEIVLNVLLAPCLVKERVRRSHIIGTVFVASGASLTAVFGPHKSAPPSLLELQEKLFRWQVLLYLIVLGLTLLICSCILKRRAKRAGDKVRGIVLGFAAGAVAGNMCFVKCSMGLLRLGLSGDWSPWTTWLPYALVVIAVCVAVGNVPLLIIALREYEALFMVTLFLGVNIAIACVSGDVILLEMADESFIRVCSYWSSVALIIVGLLVINQTVRGITSSAAEIEDASPRLLQSSDCEETGFLHLANALGEDIPMFPGSPTVEQGTPTDEECDGYRRVH